MSYEPPIAGITKNPTETQKSMPVRVAPQRNFRTTFAKVRSSFDTAYWTTIATGSGQTATQAGGNGLITTGTTVNAETIIRSTEAFTGSFTARVKTILSQRIVNQNFFVELVDVIGDARAITIASATACTVTFPSGHGFTSENVGQFMSLGAYSGTGTFVPGRYAIASVSGDNVTFTVAGFAAGSGTCSVFGWNYHRLGYQGTTATSVDYDTQRDGWASGQTVATTINTTASPGHLAIFGTENNVAFLADQLVTTSAVIQTTTRGQRVEATPANDKSLYLQIRCANGSTAPASTTTWTIGTASVEDYVPQQVSVTSARTQSPNSALQVEIIRGVALATQPVSGTVTATVANASLTAGTVTAALPTAVADVASAAITTTTTTSAFTPTFGSGYQVVIPVTVVSGTTPTMAVRIEESDDAGTNWYARYTFPTITTTGIYRSPILRLRGNRVRYVQTITGTTPSFTRAINRNQRQDSIYSGYQGKLVSAATTNATSVLAAPCEVTKLTASNTNAAVRYLKIYDKASAPTVGTDIPVATYVIPGATTGGGTNIPLTIPDSFQLGFAFALTTGATDADTGAVAANEIIVNYTIG